MRLLGNAVLQCQFAFFWSQTGVPTWRCDLGPGAAGPVAPRPLRPLNISSDGSLLMAAGVYLGPSAALGFLGLPSHCSDCNQVLTLTRLTCDTVTNRQLPWGWFPLQPPEPSRPTLRLREHWSTLPCVQILFEN